MTGARPRLTQQSLRVLAEFVAHPDASLSGTDLSGRLGLATGTLYPILARLEVAGWLTSAWEDVDPRVAKRPARRYYSPTRLGMREAGAALGEFREGGAPARPVPPFADHLHGLDGHEVELERFEAAAPLLDRLLDDPGPQRDAMAWVARAALAEGLGTLRDGMARTLADLVSLRDGAPPPGAGLGVAVATATMAGRGVILEGDLVDGLLGLDGSMAAWSGKEPRRRRDRDLLASRDGALRVGRPFVEAARTYLRAAMAGAGLDDGNVGDASPPFPRRPSSPKRTSFVAGT